eukprot:CAMPEP_0115871798 /NCGR_PEP_ID=MMETSP0287-20121206/23077_1 /TAXON_ID=412157 /ORGANISM="Chrysochromulina rotalis, Strain UIO044" /LENGTH=145 /DNA_ID=CAMNT_0003326661 /DNA_START=168 /DNA_END=602 /DNA_ORIENTATION=+
MSFSMPTLYGKRLPKERRPYSTTLPSSPPEAIRSSSGDQATQLTGAVCPASLLSSGLLRLTSHRRTVASSAPVTRVACAWCDHAAETPLTARPSSGSSCCSTCSATLGRRTSTMKVELSSPEACTYVWPHERETRLTSPIPVLKE